ncbi:MAG: OmpH family outer membrane protein [Phycisphaerales bacterium]|jgi:Skp family chaperone for outer membrane proteins|nr:OmpH family outer membrane protein [Phycisphaerales bacterium]
MKTAKSAMLLLAIATSVLLLSDRFLATSEADDAVEAPALGPASRVTLENTEAETLTLQVESNRLSWGKEPQQRVHSVAYVHIGKALAALLQGESYQEEHQMLDDELAEAQQAIAAAFEAMQEKMQGLTPEDPEFEAVTQEGQALMQQRDRFLQQANAAKSTLSAEHVERAYRELVDAVNVVADRLEIDIVNRFIPTDDPFEFKTGPNAFNQAMMQIRLRSVLRYPEEIDITEEVMEELGIE